MAQNDYKFEGWVGDSPASADGNLRWAEFEPKPWEETDIDIQVTHCGICASDLSMMRSHWGPIVYPCIAGHEIAGIAVRVGTSATGHVKVGDRVAVGSQADACLSRFGDCEYCDSGDDQYCTKQVGTFGGHHFNGGVAYGGFALYHRCPSHFVIRIPEGVSSADAATMMCGGITTYSPLRHHGCGPGKSVGIVGMGGLGHFGVLWAKALGADKVTVISRTSAKKADAIAMGADDFIATGEESNWASDHVRSFDILLSTTPSSKVPIQDYLGLVRNDGILVQVGVPESLSVTFNPQAHMIMRRVKMTGSFIGSPAEAREMLQLAAENDIKPWIEEFPMRNINDALLKMDAGKPKYRYVLVNE
uniref:alcohol dehydrogenase (NADP(+)) n=1 Tax=Bionectria ochroleuca TaxID=29856 RepID=A0A8H7TP24_BIOOC